MGRVYEEFKDLWRRPVVVAAEKAASDEQEAVEARSASIRDMRAFVCLPPYKEFRERIEREIAMQEPNPDHGSDVGACRTFMQSGLRRALRVLDDMVRLAEEKIADE